jgi:hypothetical protein
MKNHFKVWVEIEEVDVDGREVMSWSGMLEGAAVLTTNDLDRAVQFGNWLQRQADGYEEKEA